MATPVLDEAQVPGTGLTVVTVWTVAVNHSAQTPTVSNPHREYSSGCTYLSGDGTTTITWSITSGAVYQNEDAEFSVPANSVVAVVGGEANALSSSLTNESDLTVACGGPASGMMTNECQVLRSVDAQSATTAGLTTDFGLIWSPVCCAIQAVSGSEGFTWQREVGDAVYKVYLPPAVDIAHADRLTSFTGTSSLDSTDVLEVVSEPLDHAGRAGYIMILARPVEANG